MLLNAINRLIIGLIAVVVGVGFWIAAPKEVSVASENTTYTSTWEAVDNLVAKRYWDPNDPLNFGKIIIGVATWKVTGNFTSPSGGRGPYFKETWKTSDILPTFDSTNYRVRNGSSSWIAGAIWPTNREGWVGQIEIIKQGSLDPPTNLSGPESRVNGGTATCRASNKNDCIFATGAYGFTDYKDYHQSSNGSDLTNAVVIPAKWTVTGTVCEDQSPECQ